MSKEIKRIIHQHIQQEQALLSQLNELGKKRTEPASEIGKIAASEVGGLFLGEITGSGRAARYGRRLGKVLADQAQRARLQSEKLAIETQHSFILVNIKSYLSNISEMRRTLRNPNSDNLIRKVDQAQNFVKPRTKIRRTITALRNIAIKDLILNSEIPKIFEEKKEQHKTEKEPYVILKKLETKIRKCIQTKLKVTSPNWWSKRILQ